jgi:hypothetical protein
MPIDLIPESIRNNYEVFEWKHATSILHDDFPQEFTEVIAVLTRFVLARSDILVPGGQKSPIANKFDSQFYEMGWEEKQMHIHIDIDGNTVHIPTHKIDCFKNRVGLEVEWNNKDPFFDRDLNNFRLLYDLNALDIGVIITRCTNLQTIFAALGKGASYGASTTHMEKLIPRIEGNGAGGCPVLAFGISQRLYRQDL